jgi:hypothetical protein
MFVRPAIQNQWKNITTIWNNETVPTSSIERVFRLFLALTGYLFPGIYIRHFSGKYGLIPRKLALEAYVIFNLFLPTLFLSKGFVYHGSVQFIVAYMGIETLLYVLGLPTHR